MTMVDPQRMDTRQGPVSVAAVTKTRVDSPHVPRDGRPLDDVAAGTCYEGYPLGESRHEVFTSLTENSLHVVQQLRHHANQLATHLQSQQKDIDEREARLNAQVAQHENEKRASRLQLDEREKQLQQQERLVLQQARLVQEQECKLQVREDKLARSPAATPRDHTPHEAAAVGVEGQTGQDEPDASLDIPSQSGEREEVPNNVVSAHIHNNTPSGVDIDSMDVPPDNSFAKRRRRKMMSELMKKKEILDQRNDELDRRRAGIDRLHREVSQLHTDTLEMRMVTEELWVRISGRMSSAAMTRSLAELRAKLSDHYRLAATHLSQQKHELEGLSAKLNDKYRSLDERGRSLQEWFQRRHQDIEEQAARLVRREQELDQQEVEYREMRRRTDSAASSHANGLVRGPD